jgi:hypothetical protein
MLERCSTQAGFGFTRTYQSDWKGLPRTNALAYLACLPATKTQSFTTLTPGVNVIKLFFFIADDDAK